MVGDLVHHGAEGLYAGYLGVMGGDEAFQGHHGASLHVDDVRLEVVDELEVVMPECRQEVAFVGLEGLGFDVVHSFLLVLRIHGLGGAYEDLVPHLLEDVPGGHCHGDVPVAGGEIAVRDKEYPHFASGLRMEWRYKRVIL